MSKRENQKLKLMYLAKIFSVRTDDEHSITMNELISALEEYGISAERKSIYEDIEYLCNFGMCIEKIRIGKQTGYYLADRVFELPELKLLVDAVQSSKFITLKKSNQLIKKLETLTSTYQARALQRQVEVAGRIKAMNESIYYNIDKIYSAISENERISFKYFVWNEKKEKQYRHNGKMYDVSPWSLIWCEENYYLLGYDAETDSIKHYRVDKMENIDMNGNKRMGAEMFSDFDLAEYSKKLFGMFGGDEDIVTLNVKNSLAGVIIDRFGTEPTFFDNGDGSFDINVRLKLSPMFYGWVLSFGGEIRIISPQEAVDELKKIAEKVLKS